MSKQPIRIAIDGNEANVFQRVGSNIYAFEVLNQLWELVKNSKKYDCTILLARQKSEDLPPSTHNWHYKIIKPSKLWTQWALPLSLFWDQQKYDVFYTPGHYAPRICPLPYVSSVMDLAFLEFPDHYRRRDLFQLKNWTHYSVSHAKKVITISEFSKKAIHDTYGKPLKDILVAPPAVALPKSTSPLRVRAFFRKFQIHQKNYVVYLGTLQPRKNLERLIEAFEIFSRSHAASQLKKKRHNEDFSEEPPQLILAGRVGWMARGIQKRAAESPLKDRIIFTDFVGEDMKRPIYEHGRVTALVGLLEGFGIPPLESLAAGTIPVVSDSSSLPEAVGNAGIQVNPTDPKAIAKALEEVWNMPASRKEQFQKRAEKQLAQFSWEKTGRIILDTLTKVANDSPKN